jgi:hypothetical protein
MRWLVGWSSAAARGVPLEGLDGVYDDGTIQPVGAQLLWGDPDPLWAVGDWRPDEVRIITADGGNSLVVLGCCGASDEELRAGLFAARGGAYRHLTAWPGSYTAVARVGRRITIAADLAGVRPVFHSAWQGGTAYATAALPLADLIEAQLDIGYLGALLACPDSSEALGDGTPYEGVSRVPAGHALIMREGGSREIAGYEPTASLVVSAPPPVDPETAVKGVKDALVTAVRARLAAPRHASVGDMAYGARGAYGEGDRSGRGYGADAGPGPDPGPPGPDPGTPGPVHGVGIAGGVGTASGVGTVGGAGPAHGAGAGSGANGTFGAGPASVFGSGSGSGARSGAGAGAGVYGSDGRDPGPVPGMGPADRRAARGGPAPGVGADLSGGPASGTLALLAAGLPGVPGTVHGTLDGTAAGERLLAVTFNDLATGSAEPSSTAELERARAMADNPRLHHIIVTGTEEALPYAELEGPLTDEPGPSLITAGRHRRRLAAGSADHFVGHGARHALDAHPARLADLLLDRRRRHLLRPAVALARADGVPAGRSVLVPLTVYRAARRLARTPYRDGILEMALRMRDIGFAGATRSSNGAGPGARPRPDAAGPGDAVYGAADGLAAGDGGESAVTASVAALTWCRPGPAARWLTGEALAEVSHRLEAAARLRPTMERPGERRARAALARRAADHRVLEQAAELRGQRLHAPFFDNQVVRACRDLPEALRVKPGTRASVLRAVLAGAGVHDLPPGWGAPSHASQTASVRAGLRAAAGDLIQLFDAPLLADAGLIEARTVRKAIRAASEGERVPLDGIADLVSTELWLRRLLARRGSCWTGPAASRRRAVAGGVNPNGLNRGQHRPAL